MPAKITKTIWLPALLWLVVQAMLWYTNKIGITNEAEKYISQAGYLQQQGAFNAAKYIFYIIPILVIFVCIKLHIALASVVVTQLVVNALATVTFYKIAAALFAKPGQTMCATVLFITFIPLQYWNSFLYTESFFYSFCIFYMYAFIVLPAHKTSTHIIRFIIVTALFFTRPLGILFVPVTAFYYLSQSRLPRYIKWLVIAGAGIAVYFLVNFLYTGGGDMDILIPQKEGFIVCYGYAMPQPGLQVITTGNPLNNLGYFILHNPLYFVKLAFFRLVSFFTLSRAYYSALHNLYLVANMALLYGFSLLSVIKSALVKTPAFKNILLPLLFIFCAGVMLQCDDYNSRFSMPLFPWLMLLATNGIFMLPKKRTKR